MHMSWSGKSDILLIEMIKHMLQKGDDNVYIYMYFHKTFWMKKKIKSPIPGLEYIIGYSMTLMIFWIPACICSIISESYIQTPYHTLIDAPFAQVVNGEETEEVVTEVANTEEVLHAEGEERKTFVITGKKSDIELALFSHEIMLFHMP